MVRRYDITFQVTQKELNTMMEAVDYWHRDVNRNEEMETALAGIASEWIAHKYGNKPKGEDKNDSGNRPSN